MTTEKTTPNFFLLLGLNPDDSWDEVKFEQALRNKKIEWGRQGSSVGVKALTAKKHLEMIPEIRRVMTDSQLRDDQAAGARAELASDRQARIERFERQLTLAEAKDYLEKEEVEKLVLDFKDVLSEEEIRSQLTVEVRDPDVQATTKLQQLDPSTLKRINDMLEIINLSNLYELLEMPDTTSREELFYAAERLRNEMVHRPPIVAEVTVKLGLAGDAKTIFKSDEMRSKYDESLRHSRLNILLKDLDETVGRTTEKIVHAQQVLSFLRNAFKAGWKPEEALATLKEHVYAHDGWRMEFPTIDQHAQTQRCGYCHELNEKERNFCRECNRQLKITCPSCGNKDVSSDEQGCKKCGFPVGNRYLIDELLKEIRDLLSKQELMVAKERLIDAERAWPLSRPDTRLEKIRECRAELNRRIQIQQHILEQLRQSIDHRRFITAQKLLEAATVIPDRQDYENKIEEGISRARDLLRRAQSSSLRREEKADLYLEALRICTDYENARNLLRMIPPEPPGNLQAKVTGTIVNLSWDLSPTRSVQYKIVRKSGSQPISVMDGQMLETIPGRAFDDIQPEIGVPLFYVVFAVYEGVESAQGATLQQPVLLVQDVTNVVMDTDDSRVKLSWKAPPNVYSIIVVRKEHIRPNSMADGKQLIPRDPNVLVDHDVQNNHAYFYGIYCQFKHYNGRLVTSPGVFTSKATPESPPEAIRHLKVDQVPQSREVILSWEHPGKGEVVILKSERQISLRAGDRMQASALKDLGEILRGQQNTVKDIWRQPGISYYVPVVIFRDMAYIGLAQRHVCVDDISNLKVDNIGTALRLQWTWPTNCQEAIVAFGYDDWPEPNAGTANTYKITRAQYDLHGHYDIRGAMNRDHFIVVAAVIKHGGEQVITSGICKQARLASKIALSYEIKLPMRFVRKQAMLYLHMRVPGQLPTLLIVTKRNGLPLNKADGELFYRLSDLELSENDASFPLPASSFPPNTFGKLFLEDDAMNDVVNIYDPSMDKLRLG